jgi:hypothetical protein
MFGSRNAGRANPIGSNQVAAQAHFFTPAEWDQDDQQGVKVEEASDDEKAGIIQNEYQAKMHQSHQGG